MQSRVNYTYSFADKFVTIFEAWKMHEKEFRHHFYHIYI